MLLERLQLQSQQFFIPGAFGALVVRNPGRLRFRRSQVGADDDGNFLETQLEAGEVAAMALEDHPPLVDHDGLIEAKGCDAGRDPGDLIRRVGLGIVGVGDERLRVAPLHRRFKGFLLHA